MKCSRFENLPVTFGILGVQLFITHKNALSFGILLCVYIEGCGFYYIKMPMYIHTHNVLYIILMLAV